MHGTKLKLKLTDNIDARGVANDDLSALIDSIKEVGLRHPVVIDVDYRIIAGHRRVRAARALGWTQIDAMVFDVSKIIDIPDHRKQRRVFNLTLSEIVTVGERLEPLHKVIVAEQNPMIRRHASLCRVAGLTNKPRPVLPFKLAGRTNVVVARMLGISASTYGQAREIVHAARADPGAYADLVEMKFINAAHEELLRRRAGGAKREPRQRRAPPPARHPILRKTHYRNPDREMERAMHALEGVCTVIEPIVVDELNPQRAAEWADSLRRFATVFSKLAKRIAL